MKSGDIFKFCKEVEIMRLIVIFSLLLSLSLKAQLSEKFVTTLGGAGIDIGYGIKETFDGHYIIVGSTTSFGMGASDAYLILVDSIGRRVWERTYGGTSADIGKNIIVNPSDSGFIFTGYTTSFGNGGFDVYVVRTDKSGTLMWQSSFGGLDWDFGSDITFAQDGDVVVVGSTYSSKYGKKDGIVAKIDANSGNIVWQKKFGGDEDDEFVSVKLTNDGYLTLAGNTKSYGDINNDFWIFKVNNTGDSIASSKFGNLNKGERCYDFIEDNYGDLVFCGSFDTSYYNIGKNIAYVIKTNVSGNFILEYKDAGAFTDDDKFLAITNKCFGDQYFLSRKVNHVGPFGIDVQPYLLNHNLVYLEVNTYGSLKEDEAFDVICTRDNGYAMVGYTKGYGLISDDILLIKLDSSLLNAEYIVGIKGNQGRKVEKEIYYFNNVVHFQNQKKQFLSYELLNSLGRIIYFGSTTQNFIEIDPNLDSDIYVIRIVESGVKLKFIKD